MKNNKKIPIMLPMRIKNNKNLPAFIFVLFVLKIILISAQQDPEESFCKTPNNEAGVCVDLKTQLKFCPRIFSLLKTRNFTTLQNFVCHKTGSRACCPISEFNENIVQEDEKVYSDHPNFKLFPLKNCGKSSNTDRVIGGETALPGSIPFVVRIGFREKNNEQYRSKVTYNCGGTLINRRYILTAAHCFKNKDLILDNVLLGQTFEGREEECLESHGGEENVKICAKPIKASYEEIIIHPNYTQITQSQNDIALIRLDREIDTDSYFTVPICLPFLTEYHVAPKLGDVKILRSNASSVAGWGKTQNLEEVGSNSLQFVRVPIQPQILCRITYSLYNITNSQICAGGVRGQDSCLGDSGGPLYIPSSPGKNSTVKGVRYFQLGVVSYGKTICARGREPVVYTRVRNYLKWILDSVRT